MRALKYLIYCGLQLIVFGLCCHTTAEATDIFAAVGVEASIGVDSPTRDWLSGLPTQWRDQINKIVEDTLTSGNVHFDKALQDIRTRLDQAENDAACRWQAANRQTIETWKSELPFLKTPEPIRDLEDYVSQQQKAAVNHELNPYYMQGMYADLEDHVGIINCEKISEDSKSTLQSLTKLLSNHFVIWRRLDGLKCGDQNTCFGTYQAVVQKNITAAQAISDLNDAEKAVITGARTDISKVSAPTSECSFFRRFFKKNCYDTEDYEAKLIALGDVDDPVRLVVDVHSIKEKLDGAVITTQDVDPGIMRPGSTLRSPNNKFFAVMQNDCNFQVFKGAYTTAAERLAPKYVVAATGSVGGCQRTYTNCHLDLQRDRNLVVYADVTTMILTFRNGSFPISNPHSVVWNAAISDGGNSDFWLILLDSGQIEIHAGTPLRDGGALLSSKLLATKALQFVKAN